MAGPIPPVALDRNAHLLRYSRLTPSYEVYWEADSDAVNSLDSQEAAIWFVSRGDECLNCDGFVTASPAPKTK